MAWLKRGEIELSTMLANDYPLTDSRDIKGIARKHMLSVDPKIFDVPNEIMDDPRSILSFKAANRDLSTTALKSYHREPGFPWPGICSVDPRYDNTCYQIAVDASAAFRPTIDSDGFAGPNGVVKDFSAILTATGAKMSSATAPLVDRSLLLGELKYATGFKSERHRRIARALHRAMFGRRVPAPFKFPIRSSTTFPSGFGGPGSQVQKQEMCRRNLLQAEQILDWIDKGELDSLYVHAGMIIAAVTGERGQAEGVADILAGDMTAKKRPVNSMEYALSGGKSGSREAADKEFITRGIFGCKYMLGARIRTIYAFCGEVSYFLTPFLVGCRANYFEEFGYTWHHTTADQIYDGLKDFEQVIGLDVTLMDQNFPKFFLDAHADWFEDYADPRVAKLIRWMNGAPYFAPQLRKGGKPYWAGDPFDESTFKIDVGLSSGRSDNPDLGKWYMTTVYFCLMDDYIHDLLEQGTNDDVSIQKVLKGEHPVFGLKDMGDDAILGFRPGNSLLAEKMRVDLKKAGGSGKAGLSPYAMLDLEEGIAFLGNVVLKDQRGALIRPVPNPVTYLVNRFSPERSVNTGYSMYWAHGMLAANEHYSRAGSIIGDLDRLADEVWRFHLPGVPTPNQMANKARSMRPLPDGDVMNQADIEVLLDPSKLYYKYTEKDVSAHIDSLFRATIEAEFIEQTIGKYYT